MVYRSGDAWNCQQIYAAPASFFILHKIFIAKSYNWLTVKKTTILKLNQKVRRTIMKGFYNNPEPKSGSQIKTYVILILVTTVISSLITGVLLFGALSNSINNQLAIGKNRVIPIPVTKIALSKGSAVTEIAKKVGPSVV